jgi:acetyltransferase-like isoleucine patch superfamily enzyme
MCGKDKVQKIRKRICSVSRENGMRSSEEKRVGYEFARNFGILFLNAIAARIPFHAIRLFLYRRVFRVGAGSSILMKATVRGFRITIGEGCVINSDVLLDGRGAALILGNFVDVAPYVKIWTLDHDPNSSNHAARARPVTVGDYVWLSSGATILPGVSLGKGCVVAAGAVVTKDVAPWTIVAGIPARAIGQRQKNVIPRLPYRPWFE